MFISAAQGLLCRGPGSKTVTEKIKSFLKIFVRSAALEPRKQKQRGLVRATGRDRCQKMLPLFFDASILKNFSPPKNAGVLNLRLTSNAQCPGTTMTAIFDYKFYLHYALCILH